MGLNPAGALEERHPGAGGRRTRREFLGSAAGVALPAWLSGR